MEKTNTSVPAKTVEDYIRDLPRPVQELLEKVRQAIRDAAPAAEEIISYRVPTYKHHGPLVHFAAFKNHCSLVVVDGALIGTFSKDLKPYRTTGTTIHFTVEKPLPSALIRKIVRARVRQNEEHAARMALAGGKKR